MKNTTLIGTTYGRLTTNSDPERRAGKTFVGVVCTCGVSQSVLLAELVEGRRKSCGCLGREVSALLRQTGDDGQPRYAPTREYRAWANLQQKCKNPRSMFYGRNGGRGVTACPEWDGNFPRFFADMGKCPDGYCLVRLKHDEGFTVENCRWSASRRRVVEA